MKIDQAAYDVVRIRTAAGRFQKAIAEHLTIMGYRGPSGGPVLGSHISNMLKTRHVRLGSALARKGA